MPCNHIIHIVIFTQVQLQQVHFHFTVLHKHAMLYYLNTGPTTKQWLQKTWHFTHTVQYQTKLSKPVWVFNSVIRMGTIPFWQWASAPQDSHTSWRAWSRPRWAPGHSPAHLSGALLMSVCRSLAEIQEWELIHKCTTSQHSSWVLCKSAIYLPEKRPELSIGPGYRLCSPTLYISQLSKPTYFFHCLNHRLSIKYLLREKLLL